MCRSESRGSSEAKALRCLSGCEGHESGPGFRVNYCFIPASGVTEPIDLAVEFQKILDSFAWIAAKLVDAVRPAGGASLQRGGAWPGFLAIISTICALLIKAQAERAKLAEIN